MNNAAKRIICLILTLCVVIFAVEPFLQTHTQSNIAMADKKDDDKDKDKDKNKNENGATPPKIKELNVKSDVGDDGDVTVKENEGNEDDLWTNYAQILMASAVKKEKAKKDKKKKEEENKTITEKVTGYVTAPFNKKINGILGKGGVSLEVPFSKMASISEQIDEGKHGGKGYKPSGKAGRLTASYLATFSNYGYIETTSGQAIANEISQSFTTFFRLIAGGVATIGIMLVYTLNKIQDWIADFMIGFNPYRVFQLTGVGNLELPDDNPVVKSMNGVIDWIGFSRKLTYSIMGLGLTVITLYFTLKFLFNLRHGSVRKASNAFKEGLIRILVAAMMLSFLSLTANLVGNVLKEIKHSTSLNDNTVVKHLYDQHAIASGTNLSPSGGTSTKRPDSDMAKNYIDNSFDPSVSRSRIAKANKNANWILNDTPKTSEGQRDLSFTLLEKYMKNRNFNVNTYIADLRRGSNQTGTGELLPGVATYGSDFQENGKNASPKTLELSMWSATQNVDKEKRNPGDKHFRPSGRTGVDPGKETGVLDDSTFSTQSVVLMLQSSFDGSSANFYAYNLGASSENEQQTMKSLSTIKTQWKEVTLPGNGILGHVASWLSLISESISYSIIGLAVLTAMLTTNLLLAYVLFWKQAALTLLTGSINSALATFYLYIGSTASTVLATYLPDLFVKFITGLSSGAASGLKEFIPASFVEIIVSLGMIYIAWMIGFKWKLKPSGETPVRMMTTILSRSAIAFESRVKELDKEGGATNFKQATKGMYKEARTRFAETKDSMSKDVSGAINTYKNKGARSAKGAWFGATQGAAVGVKSRNPVGIVTATTSGAAIGAKSGYDTADNHNLSNKDLSKKVKGDVKNVAASTGLNRDSANKPRKLDKRASIRDEALDNMNKAKSKDASKYTDKNISKQLSVPVEDNAKGNYLANERKFRTFKANQAAQYATGEDGYPIFGGKELQKMNEAEDMVGYIDAMKDTVNGNDYALNTESAAAALIDTQFIGDDGKVDIEKVNKFEEALDAKQSKGTLSDEDMQQKALIDSAFVNGAKERYATANASDGESGYTASNKIKQNTTSPTSSRTNAKPYTTTGGNSPYQMKNASTSSPSQQPSTTRKNNSSAKSSGNATANRNVVETQHTKDTGAKPKTSTQKPPRTNSTTPSTNKMSAKPKTTSYKANTSRQQQLKSKPKKPKSVTPNKPRKTSNAKMKTTKTSNASSKPKKTTSKTPHPNSKPKIKRNNKK